MPDPGQLGVHTGLAVKVFVPAVARDAVVGLTDTEVRELVDTVTVITV
jgi:hypothetical protein